MDYLGSITYMKFLMKLIREDPCWHLNKTLRAVHELLGRYCEAFDEFTKEDVVTADFKNQSNYHCQFSFDDRDSEADCVERIQKLINKIYHLNPNLDYEYRPRIFLSVSCEEESGISETMQVKSSKRDLIKKLDELEKNYKRVKKMKKRIDAEEKLQKDTKLKEKNDELIEKCIDIECNFSRKTNTDHLSALIKDYRKSNKLDKQDTVENLIKAINVECGELLEIINWGKVIDPKKVEEELADVLIYCFSLAYELNTPVDRIIARKIKKNIERGRQYE